MDEVAPMSLVLASTSPRRHQLLAQAGYTFTVIAPEFDESTCSAVGHAPCSYAEALALGKARSVAPRYPEALVIGADTLVDADGEIIGKPDDAADAERITRKLFSASHQVITGLALVRISDRTEIVRSDVTTVYPRKMTEEQVFAHIAGRSWEGKAGAYAIQETGDEFVERIEGSLTNVMGLPMELLQRLLKRVL
jgi:septum formation protein